MIQVESPVLRGLHLRGFHYVDDALGYGIRVVYWGTAPADYPISDSTMPQLERNGRIRMAYSTGTPVPDLVREYQISSQRVYQILQDN